MLEIHSLASDARDYFIVSEVLEYWDTSFSLSLFFFFLAIYKISAAHKTYSNVLSQSHS